MADTQSGEKQDSPLKNNELQNENVIAGEAATATDRSNLMRLPCSRWTLAMTRTR